MEVMIYGNGESRKQFDKLRLWVTIPLGVVTQSIVI